MSRRPVKVLNSPRNPHPYREEALEVDDHQGHFPGIGSNQAPSNSMVSPRPRSSKFSERPRSRYGDRPTVSPTPKQRQPMMSIQIPTKLMPLESLSPRSVSISHEALPQLHRPGALKSQRREEKTGDRFALENLEGNTVSRGSPTHQPERRQSQLLMLRRSMHDLGTAADVVDFIDITKVVGPNRPQLKPIFTPFSTQQLSSRRTPSPSVREESSRQTTHMKLTPRLAVVATPRTTSSSFNKQRPPVRSPSSSSSQHDDDDGDIGQHDDEYENIDRHRQQQRHRRDSGHHEEYNRRPQPPRGDNDSEEEGRRGRRYRNNDDDERRQQRHRHDDDSEDENLHRPGHRVDHPSPPALRFQPSPAPPQPRPRQRTNRSRRSHRSSSSDEDEELIYTSPDQDIDHY